MDRIILFIVGALTAVATEAFWKGGSRWPVALWGGVGMLLLRRIMLRFSSESRVLLCIFGALLLIALRLAMLILQDLPRRTKDNEPHMLTVDMPSLSYSLYRFLLIAPAYAVIEYLEARFRM